MRRFFIPLVSILLVACEDAPPAGPTAPSAPLPVASVHLNSSKVTLLSGNGFQLVATSRDAMGQPVPGGPATWRSSSTAVATVYSNGYVVGFLPGTATIDLTIDGKSTFVGVVVSGAIPHTMDVVNGAGQRPEVGALVTEPPQLRVRDIANRPVKGIVVTFTVSSGSGTISAPATATTDAAGLVTMPAWRVGATPGENTVIASTPLLSATVTVSATAYRSTLDRLDEVTGNTVHFLYVLPSDGEDRSLDTSGRLAASIAVFQDFALAKTGRRLRIDTFNGGVPDITFVRLPHTDAELNASATPQQNIETSLRALGILKPKKIYAVYYDGSSRNACGQADVSLANGQVGAVYLRGFFNSGREPCAGLDGMAVSAHDAPRYWDFVMLHEIMHVMGIVGSGAPHYVSSPPGHVNDPTDLMYTGPREWTPLYFDAGNDDYSGSALPASLPNFLTSSYTESASRANLGTAARAAARAPMSGLRIDLIEGRSPFP